MSGKIVTQEKIVTIYLITNSYIYITFIHLTYIFLYYRDSIKRRFRIVNINFLN